MRACVCVCVCRDHTIHQIFTENTQIFFYYLSSQGTPVVFLPCDDRQILCPCEILPSDEQLLAPQRAPKALFLLHQGRCFPRNHVQQQETGAERGAQCHRFVLLLLVLMVTGLKTRAAAATESKTGQSLPGEPPATDGAGTHGKATSTPGQSRVGWGLPPLC